jgi:hypothetical protein
MERGQSEVRGVDGGSRSALGRGGEGVGIERLRGRQERLEVEDKPDMWVPPDRGREEGRRITVRENWVGRAGWAGLAARSTSPFFFFFFFLYSFLISDFIYNFCILISNHFKPKWKIL